MTIIFPWNHISAIRWGSSQILPHYDILSQLETILVLVIRWGPSQVLPHHSWTYMFFDDENSSHTFLFASILYISYNLYACLFVTELLKKWGILAYTFMIRYSLIWPTIKVKLVSSWSSNRESNYGCLEKCSNLNISQQSLFQNQTRIKISKKYIVKRIKKNQAKWNRTFFSLVFGS